MRRRSAAAFFFKHAGYSYDPKTQTRLQGRWACARQLALAEEQAANRNWCFCWEPDESPDHSWCDNPDPKHEHEVLGCIVRDFEGKILASLWGIYDPDVSYSRVIEAELASEALHGQ